MISRNAMLKVLHCRLLLSMLLLMVFLPLSGLHAKPMGGDFTLIDHNGQKFELEQLRGKVVLLFFGYTTCPDVCPKELSDLAIILNSLGDRAEQVHGLFVTVDPERDTQDVLKKYVSYFSSNITGLRGSEEEINTVASQYRVPYKLHKDQGKYYMVDHAANLYVIAQDGRLWTVVPFGFPPRHVLGIVNNLIEHGRYE